MWAVLAFSVQAFGTERIVPDDYPTIQAAIDASWDGGTVIIADGIYW